MPEKAERTPRWVNGLSAAAIITAVTTGGIGMFWLGKLDQRVIVLETRIDRLVEMEIRRLEQRSPATDFGGELP